MSALEASVKHMSGLESEGHIWKFKCQIGIELKSLQIDMTHLLKQVWNQWHNE